MKIFSLIIPVLVVVAAVWGSKITGGNMTWYHNLNLMPWTPPGAFIGIVWTIIFILFAISGVIVAQKAPLGSRFYIILGLMVLNLLLNVLWSYLFFGQHQIFPAIFEAMVLDLSVIALIVAIYPLSTLSALLFLPYACWVAFATYLTYSIWFLNK